MASMFGGNTGWTYDQIQQKRKIAAELMAANANTPRNVGEGLNAIGRALAVRGIEKRADKRDAELRGEYDASRNAVYQSIFGGGAPAGAGASYTPPAPVDPASPQGIASDTMAALGKGPDFAALEQQYGLPQGYLQRTAQIESGGNPNAQNPNSSAGGMFQFIDSTAKQYGLTNKFDPMASADAAARLARDNLGYLKQALGREPSAGELYLAHQQGAGGAAKLLAAGNAPAASVVGGDAARLNGGDGMSAADFAGKWTGKFGGQPQQPQADLGTIAELLSNPYASAGDKAILGAMLQRQMDASDPMRAMELERAQLELERMRNPPVEELTTRRALAAEAGLQPGTPEYRSYMATGALPKAETPTGLMREYDMAVSQGYKGTIQQYQIDLKKAGASNTTVTVGGEAGVPADEEELRKKLGGKEGEAWSGYLDAGAVSAGTAQDMQLMDQLIDLAPTGPLQGRMVEMFPGISDAGAAFQSVVSRVAPTLRAPGSGATSDIEYDGMVKSLPALKNRPEANRAISSMMKAKAQINMDRAAVVSAYQNNEISAADARKQLQEINSRSIMTPELKAVISALDPKEGASAADDEMFRKYGIAP